MRPLRFRKLPVEVEAMRVSVDNAAAIAIWCNGTPSLHTGVFIRTVEGAKLAIPGDWVVRAPTGDFSRVPPGAFAATYEAVTA